MKQEKLTKTAGFRCSAKLFSLICKLAKAEQIKESELLRRIIEKSILTNIKKPVNK